MRLVMDSRPPEEPSRTPTKTLPCNCPLVAPEDVAKDWEERLRAGGLGYGDLKKALFEQYWEFCRGQGQARRVGKQSRPREPGVEGRHLEGREGRPVLDRARKNYDA